MKLTVNYEQKRGVIKPMHGVGQPPISGISDQFFHYLDEAHIPFSRLHDVGGAYGGYVYVDIPNIFRDFDADVNDPASYDFAFTDILLTNLRKHGVEPIYRLGVTIENYHFVKSYRLDPPKDPQKWAEICEHIIRHYNEGWANGFRCGITYWEIWNEPDNDNIIVDPSGASSGNQMWHGTKEQYYELYDVAAKHLKAVFGDSIKVGGYGSCGFYAITQDPARYGLPGAELAEKDAWQKRCDYFIDFFDGFLDYIKAHRSPIDFFSWHSYEKPEVTRRFAAYLDQRLTEAGYPDLETQCNEWNPDPSVDLRGSSQASADVAAMMCAMQHTKTTVMCYYDARMGPSVYGGLFNPMTYQPLSPYYAVKAFGELYALGTEVALEGLEDGTYGLAAVGSDGKRALMLVNLSGHDKLLSTDGAYSHVYRVDKEHPFTDEGAFTDGLVLRHHEVLLLTDYAVQ